MHRPTTWLARASATFGVICKSVHGRYKSLWHFQINRLTTWLACASATSVLVCKNVHGRYKSLWHFEIIVLTTWITRVSATCSMICKIVHGRYKSLWHFYINRFSLPRKFSSFAINQFCAPLPRKTMVNVACILDLENCLVPSQAIFGTPPSQNHTF